ncbi:MAG: DUF4307 domain-containing protein [Actinomycetes bacterium]
MTGPTPTQRLPRHLRSMQLPEGADLGHLQTRYGAGQPRWGVPVAIALVALPFVAWVVWAGLLQGDQEIRWNTSGFREPSPTNVIVDFDVFLPAGTTVTCTVRALDQRGLEVGRAEVPVTSATSDVSVVYPLAVTALPSSAFVESCRPAE